MVSSTLILQKLLKKQTYIKHSVALITHGDKLDLLLKIQCEKVYVRVTDAENYDGMKNTI